MTKAKYLLGTLLVAVVIAAAGYWWQSHTGESGPAMRALPPAQAIGFVALPGLPDAWHDIHRTKFYAQVSSPAFWQAALGPEGFQRLTDRLHQWEQQLGWPLNEATLDLVLGREVGLALVPSHAGRWPVDLIAYVRVSGAEKLVESLGRGWAPANHDLTRETQMVDGIEIITLRLKGTSDSLSYAFVGSLAVLSSHQRWVVDAIAAHHGTAGERLYTLPLLQEMQLDTTPSLLAYGYYDAAKMPDQLAVGFPGTVQTGKTTAMRVLPTAGKLALKATRAPEGVKIDALATYSSAGTPRTFRPTARDGMTPLFGGVPAETLSLLHVDVPSLQGLWRPIKQLTAAASLNGVKRYLDDFRAWAGVDLERDVLPITTGLVSFGITGPMGPQAGGPLALPGLFLTVGVTDEARARQLMQSIGEHAGGPLFSAFLQRLPHAGDEILYLGNSLLFSTPGYVVSRKRLMVGSDLNLLQHMLDATHGRAPTLADTAVYKGLRKHFRSEGGNVTFIDVTALLAKAQEWWVRLRFLTQIMARFNPQVPALGPLSADHVALLELFRPVRSITTVSRAEAQGMRTETFIVLEDLQEGK